MNSDQIFYKLNLLSPQTKQDIDMKFGPKTNDNNLNKTMSQTCDIDNLSSIFGFSSNVETLGSHILVEYRQIHKVSL